MGDDSRLSGISTPASVVSSSAISRRVRPLAALAQAIAACRGSHPSDAAGLEKAMSTSFAPDPSKARQQTDDISPFGSSVNVEAPARFSAICDGSRQLVVFPLPVPPSSNLWLLPASMSSRLPLPPRVPTTMPGLGACPGRHTSKLLFNSRGRLASRAAPYDAFRLGFSPRHVPLWNALMSPSAPSAANAIAAAAAAAAICESLGSAGAREVPFNASAAKSPHAAFAAGMPKAHIAKAIAMQGMSRMANLAQKCGSLL